MVKQKGFIKSKVDSKNAKISFLMGDFDSFYTLSLQLSFLIFIHQ